MKKIAIAFIAAMTVLSFAGCKKKDAMKEAMTKMEGFKTAMCACKDKGCAEKVDKDMKSYSDSMKGKGEKDAKMSADDEKKMMQMVADYSKCQQTAMGPEMGAPPAGGEGAPPAGGAAPADPAAGGAAPPAGGAAPPAGGAAPPAEPKK